jgi:two-component system, OmpR family, response regulator VicR
VKKILVVDDDEDILHIVQHILITHGFDVQTHSTGLNVPDIVMHYHPNLILLDIRLPGKLGTEVCKELKQIHSNLPILLFSAHANKGQAFALCHADGFIQKPFDIKNLIDTINLHLK